MDAIRNMIYWQGNKERGVNQNAVAFIQHMNKGLKEKYPSAILCAEDSTSFPKVTERVADGGLGFDYKWDMGWMNDTLRFMQTAPAGRRRDYHKLTFSMMYFYDEHFLLPFSHDEVVHGKAAIVQKMHGAYADQFAQARTLYLYMYTHPGKKLNFMGNEIGQLREWDEKRAQDWALLKYPAHDSFAHFMKDLNHLYLENAALYARDYQRDGFEWVDCQRESDCLYAYKRKGENQQLLVVLNFSDAAKDYSFEIPQATHCELLLSTDAEKYGGKGMTQLHRCGKNAVVSLAPFSAVLLSDQKEKADS